MKSVRFVMVLHNHQPVGNFDDVIAQACEKAYGAFLDVADEFPAIRMVLHYSGPLLEWIEANNHPLSNRIRKGVNSGRFELLGGGFGEPILTMLPQTDAIGQIGMLRRHLRSRYGASARGIWLTERVWEPQLVSTLADAGVEYTVVDDFHFRSAGLHKNDLSGYYTTEDQGRILRVFSGSEFLRYAIPFRDPNDTLEYLRRFATEDGNNVVVYADDGEKFGLWPETHEHVYESGWLRRFFDALNSNSHWIRFSTLAESVDTLAPRGHIYLPEASYREMLEWALLPAAQTELDDILKELKDLHLFDRVRPFIRGGSWRNFKVKYAEAARMYARMIEVSRFAADRASARSINEALVELYRGQCNCAYWHGVFGGLYMPFLRFAIYQRLLRAENLLAGRHTRPSRKVYDFDFDLHPEVKLQNGSLACYIKPDHGGTLYELDDLKHEFNLTAVMTRREEAYHRRLLKAAQSAATTHSYQTAVSIHERVRIKEAGLEKLLHYDDRVRESLVDRFYSNDTTPEQLMNASAEEWGDFSNAKYELVLPKSKACSVTLRRDSHVGPPRKQVPVSLAKRISLGKDARVEVRHVLTFPAGAPEGTLFGVEFNLGLMAGNAPDRNYFTGARENLGNLSTILHRNEEPSLGMVDEWLGIEIWIYAEPAAMFWTYPVETVNDSEGGFERVYQGSAIIPHWQLQALPAEEQIFILTLEVRHR